MAKSVNISKNKPEQRSLDYDALYKEGIDLIQQYSGAVWTDFNHHDPGVTLLEYLCFGITDIGYRCSFPVTDFLYAREHRRFQPVDNAFFAPDQILPCMPLTIDDYRKLILDRIPEIANVWVEPVLDQREKADGLYDIWLQLNKEIDTYETPESIGTRVRNLFAENRNLCEDLREVRILEPHTLDIEATIHLKMDASPEQVLADLIHDLEHLLAPGIKFHSMEEMLSRGHTLNELLEGPLTEHGFLLSADFKPLGAHITLPELRDVMDATEGVSNVGNIRLKLNNLPLFSEEIHTPNTYLVLGDDIRSKRDDHPIQMFRNGQRTYPNLFLVNQILKSYTAREYQHFKQKTDLRIRPEMAQKDLADIGAYYSIQQFFPAVYGISAFGLPRDADFRRQAQARQLKGYLAIFETLLAGYLKQLTQVKHLFSIGNTPGASAENPPETHRKDASPHAATNDVVTLKITNRDELEEAMVGPSYFAQFPFNIPDIDPLLHSDEPEIENARQDIAQKLAAIAAINDNVLDRRNEFLDHLLARFGESVQGELLNQFLDSPDDFVRLKKFLINTKCRILQDYETLSRDRGKAFDYRMPNHVQHKKINWLNQETNSWSSQNVPGLKKRLCAWLNFEYNDDHGLTDFFPFEQFHHHHVIPGSDAAKNGLPMAALLRSGKKENSYRIRETGDRQWEIDFLENADGNPYLLFRMQDAERDQVEQTLKNFADSVKVFEEYSKSFFIVEHILLRPQQRGKHWMTLSIQEENLENAFVSLGAQTLDELESIAQDLLTAASDRDNYVVLPDGKAFFLVIKQGNQPMLVSSRSFDGFLDASALRDTTLAAMQAALRHDPRRINDWIAFHPELVKGLEIDNEFYAHRFSVVLPDWPTLFATQGFPPLFQHLLAQHMPVHLRADLHWLNWPDMQAFESVYKKWLQAKSDPEPDPQIIDELSFTLVEKLTPADDPALTALAALRAKEAEQKTMLETTLSKNRIEALLIECGLSFLFSPNELQIIEGIDASLEYWLKKAGFFTWSLLAVAPEEQLRNVCLKAGMPQLAKQAPSWPMQARHAAAGEWDKLEQLQLDLTRKQDEGPNRPSKLSRLAKKKQASLSGNQS